MVGTNRYDDYGVPAATNIGRFQYTGQTWMPELGLYNYKARFYDPKLGRFMQTDPIGYGDGMNMYAYVGGDPVNMVDTSGTCETTINDLTITWHYVNRSGCDLSSGSMAGLYDAGAAHYANGGRGTIIYDPSAINVYGSRGGGTGGSSNGAALLSGNRSSAIGTSGGRGISNHPVDDELLVLAKKSIKKIAKCASNQLGLGELAEAAAVASGQPIPGTKRFVTPGSSRGTSAAGMGADIIFGRSRFPRRVPTIVGGPGTRRALAIAGTKSVARFAGRAVPIVGWALIAYDVGSIAKCVVSGE